MTTLVLLRRGLNLDGDQFLLVSAGGGSIGGGGGVDGVAGAGLDYGRAKVLGCSGVRRSASRTRPFFLSVAGEGGPRWRHNTRR